MDFLFNYFPFIILVILFAFGVTVKIAYVTNHKIDEKKVKTTYVILIILEIISIIFVFIFPPITNYKYLSNGMSYGSRYSISNDKFQVKYVKANRG